MSRLRNILNNQSKNKSTLLFLALILFAFVIPKNIAAQKFSATTDRDKMLIGEQLILTLQLANYNPSKFGFENWPSIPDSFQNCEVIKRGHIDTLLVNGLQTIRQEIAITSFDSGKKKIGPYRIVIINKENGKKTTTMASAIPLTVLLPDISNLSDYHEMKDVIDVPEPFDWYFAIGTGLIALVITILLWKIFAKKKAVDKKPDFVPRENALKLALRKIEELNFAPSNQKDGIKNYHAALDMTIREYIENASGIKALKATSYELLRQLPVYIQQDNVKQKMEHIFQINTAVKYALFIPDEKDSIAIKEEIIYCLKILDEAIQQANRYAD